MDSTGTTTMDYNTAQAQLQAQIDAITKQQNQSITQGIFSSLAKNKASLQAQLDAIIASGNVSSADSTNISALLGQAQLAQLQAQSFDTNFMLYGTIALAAGGIFAAWYFFIRTKKK